MLLVVCIIRLNKISEELKASVTTAIIAVSRSYIKLLFLGDLHLRLEGGSRWVEEAAGVIMKQDCI